MRFLILGFLAAAFLASPASAQDISLRLPVACEVGKTCFIQHYVDRDPSTAAKDFQCGSLTYDGHDGTDIRIPTMAAQKAGVAVVAAADGKVLRGRDGVADVSVAESDRSSVGNRECGNGVVIDHGQGFETQYCHMAKGGLSVRPGDDIKAGDQIGRVGLSGMTEFPHLHFTLRRDGKVVDPFAFGAEADSCGGGRSLWDAKTASTLSYRAGDVLNKGFASGPVTMAAVESGEIEQTVPTARSPALVAYVRAIGLRSGDAQFLTLVDPEGKTLAENKPAALDRDKAQWMLFSGVKAPPGGFKPGLYRATYTVMRGVKAAITQSFTIELKP